MIKIEIQGYKTINTNLYERNYIKRHNQPSDNYEYNSIFEQHFEQLVVEKPSVTRGRVDQIDENDPIETTLTCTNLLSSIIGSKILVNQT